MDRLDLETGASGLGSGRARRFVTRLVATYGAFTIFIGAGLALSLAPPTVLAGLRAQSVEAVTGGLGAAVLGALLMALTPLVGTLLITAARSRGMVAAGSGWAASLRRIGPGTAAREGQGLITAFGTVLTCLAVWLLWPARAIPVDAAANPNLLGAIVIGIAFVSLIIERTVADFPAPQMPEAPSLRSLLLVVTLVLAIAGALEIGRGAGLAWVHWIFVAFAALPIVVVAELAVRAFARLFLPPPLPADAVAVSENITLALLTGGPRAPGLLIRKHLGLDFARSWALSYVIAAAMPAVFATLLLCWTLSGLKLIDIGERGVYERFGAPVKVLGSGIHLFLPWPLGILRPVENGTIHEIAVSNAPQADGAEKISAEAVPPASANHLWDSADPAEAEYLVASQNGNGLQGFQVVSAEIRVLYRTGLSDADAMEAVYGATDQGSLVREAASRVVARYFASHTLDEVMGAARQDLAETLRGDLAADVAAHHAGIEILTVLIEAVHPPAGAAGAYHAVQAAEINANASISNERGRAERMAGVAQQEAHKLGVAAEAVAIETTETAKGESYQFAADRKAYQTSPDSFLMEHAFAQMTAAYSKVKLTIVDHRLGPGETPILDLRAQAAAAPATQQPASAAAVATAPSAPPAFTPEVEDEK